MLEYAIPLIALTCLACIQGGAVRRAAFIIMMNWVMGTIFVLATHNYTPWLFSTAIDSGAAYLILTRRSGHIPALIGVTYLLQVAIHGGFALSNNPDQYQYWQILTGFAFLQLLLLGGWLIGNYRKANHWPFVRNNIALVDTTDTEGVGK